MPPKKQKQAKKGQKPLDIVGDALADKIANQIDEDATQANTSAGASQEPTPTSQQTNGKTMDFKDQEEEKSLNVSSNLEEEKTETSSTNQSTADLHEEKKETQKDHTEMISASQTAPSTTDATTTQDPKDKSPVKTEVQPQKDQKADEDKLKKQQEEEAERKRVEEADNLRKQQEDAIKKLNEDERAKVLTHIATQSSTLAEIREKVNKVGGEAVMTHKTLEDSLEKYHSMRNDANKLLIGSEFIHPEHRVELTLLQNDINEHDKKVREVVDLIQEKIGKATQAKADLVQQEKDQEAKKLQQEQELKLKHEHDLQKKHEEEAAAQKSKHQDVEEEKQIHVQPPVLTQANQEVTGLIHVDEEQLKPVEVKQEEAKVEEDHSQVQQIQVKHNKVPATESANIVQDEQVAPSTGIEEQQEQAPHQPVEVCNKSQDHIEHQECCDHSHDDHTNVAGTTLHNQEQEVDDGCPCCDHGEEQSLEEMMASYKPSPEEEKVTKKPKKEEGIPPVFFLLGGAVIAGLTAFAYSYLGNRKP